MMELIDHRNDSPSLTYLATILDFFLTNKDSLNIPDMTVLCAEVERCRAYANTDRVETITIFRNGNEEKIDRIKPGFNISRESVFPNPYEHLDHLKEVRDREELEQREAEERARESRKMPVVREPGVAQVPMAAAPA